MVTPVKRIALASALALLGSFTVGSPTHQNASAATGIAIPPYLAGNPAPSNYSLVFSDEFNGDSVDASKWNLRHNDNFGTGNREDECYRRENAQVSDGQLHLVALPQTVQCNGTNPDTGTSTYYFTSAFATTKAAGGGPQKFAFTKGYEEAMIKLPVGNAWWGAFWNTGAEGAPGWPDYGEFDVMEQLGNYPDTTVQTFHYKCSTGPCQTTSDNQINTRTNGISKGVQLTADNVKTYIGDGTSRFIRYGMLWDNEKIVWYIDGVPIRSFDGTRIRRYKTDDYGKVTVAYEGTALPAVKPSFGTVLNTPHVLDLNLAVGGGVPKYLGYTGGETATGYNLGNFFGDTTPSMDVEYVRVYQLT